MHLFVGLLDQYVRSTKQISKEIEPQHMFFCSLLQS